MTGMNRSIKRVSLAVLVLFVVLLINVNYLQAADTGNLATQPLNDRAEYAQASVQRGSIVTADGTVIATSTSATGGTGLFKYQRSYPGGVAYAPVTGYDTIYSQSQAPNYAAGVELTENSLLSGTGSQLAFRNFIDTITNKPQKGASVQVTVNSAAQKAAYDGLAAKLQGITVNGKQAVGGVVALNPSTGAILALASYPSYDPNALASHVTSTVNSVYSKLSGESPSPLINNASQTTMPPGSTFKIVTSSAWYTQDITRKPTDLISSPEPLLLPNGNDLTNDGGEQCGDGSGKTEVIVAFAQSCNTPFAELGVQLGSATIKSMATSYGLNDPGADDIPGISVAPSNFTFESDKSFTAYDAIGQHDTTVTPLQEAEFAATVANNGVLMKPYLIQSVTASDLSTVQQTQSQQLSQPISSTVAGYEKQMMTAVVQDSEGTAFAFNAGNENGLIIAGKTGTAQNGSANPDAVFTAFAPADNPKIAVGVMIQGGGYGASAAAPIAVAVINDYLATLGNPR